MPKQTQSKSRRRFSVLAKDETTGIFERVTPRATVLEKFENVGKRRKPYKPKVKPVITNPLSLEERTALQEETELENWARGEQARRFAEENKKSLADRLSSPTPVQSQDKVEAGDSSIEEKKPLPKFKKSKIMHRIKEYQKILDATWARCRLTFIQVVPLIHILGPNGRDRILEFKKQLEFTRDNLELIGHSISPKEWRHIRNDCHKIKMLNLDPEDDVKSRVDRLVAASYRFQIFLFLDLSSFAP